MRWKRRTSAWNWMIVWIIAPELHTLRFYPHFQKILRDLGA